LGSLLRPVSFYVCTSAIFSKLIGNASPSAMAEAWSLPSKSSDWIREITEKIPANASLVLLGDEDTHGARYAGAAYLTERTHYSVHISHVDEFRHIELLGPPRDACVIGTWQDAERFSAKSRISALQRGYSLYEPFVAQSYSDIVSHNLAVKRFLIELCLSWMDKHGDVGYVDCPVTWE
jgi:hypothetical protein